MITIIVVVVIIITGTIEQENTAHEVIVNG